MTMLAGLLDVGQPKEGETLLVIPAPPPARWSSLVGQIGKIKLLPRGRHRRQRDDNAPGW